MAKQEIPRDEWIRFFNDYSHQHQGWLATVEIKGKEIGDRIEAKGLPFQGVTFDEKGSEKGSIAVFLDKGTQEDETHIIAHPTHLRIENEGERERELEIEASDGTKTLIHFDHPSNPQVAGRL
jgi:hypothetical protein